MHPSAGRAGRDGGPERSDWRDRQEAVEAFANEIGHSHLVNGQHDVVSDGERTRVNRTGNPGMTVGGTGDVLAGVVGALAATTDPFRAAAAGAYGTGVAGDLAAEANGNGLLATDLLDRIPEAMRDE